MAASSNRKGRIAAVELGRGFEEADDLAVGVGVCGHAGLGQKSRCVRGDESVDPFGVRTVGIRHLGDRLEHGIFVVDLLLPAAALRFQI